MVDNAFLMAACRRLRAPEGALAVPMHYVGVALTSLTAALRRSESIVSSPRTLLGA